MHIGQVRFSAFSLGCVVACFAAALNAQTVSRQIQSGGTAQMQAGPLGIGSPNGPELDPAISRADSHDGGNDATGKVLLHRTPNPVREGTSVRMEAAAVRRVRPNQELTPGLNTSFDGLNFYQERYANGGNQFSLEPPDQGLCVGNGYVVESVNSAIRVYDTSGYAKTNVVSLNQFYNYPPAIDRKTLKYGPELTDPSCYYDPKTERWFHVVLTLDRVGTSRSLSGENHLDLAVSKSADPTEEWFIYRIPVQDDGTDGTPNHHCKGGPCLGDYPHIGVDKHGVYLTTNEFPFLGRGYVGAQIYALPKKALEDGSETVELVQYNTGDPGAATASGLPGFAVWPAVSATGDSPTTLGGTEYFLSSLAIFQPNGVDSRLQLWSLTNTKSLEDGEGIPTLTSSIVETEPYGIPGFARQPGTGTDGVGQAPGGGDINFPLGQCLNLPWCATTYLLGQPDPMKEVISPLAANDSRMQQVYYADGNLWGSVGTGISYGNNIASVGLAYFALRPEPNKGTPTAHVINQGYVANPDVDLTYGTVAVTEHGDAMLSFTATGPSNYPSVGYTLLEPHGRSGDIFIAAPGLGVDDGFTGYQAYSSRPRWGDYGAAVAVGDSIWFAQEYIGQNCSLSEYLASTPFGSCDATRGVLGNWYTRVSKLTP